jgi:hypothetical protein
MLRTKSVLERYAAYSDENNVNGLISPPRMPRFPSSTTPNAGESAEKGPVTNSSHKRKLSVQQSPQAPNSNKEKKIKMAKEDLYELQDFIDLTVGQMGRKAYSTASETLNKLYNHREYFPQLQPRQLVSIAAMYKVLSTRPSSTENLYQSLNCLQPIIKKFIDAGKFNNVDGTINPELHDAYKQNDAILLELELEKEIEAKNYPAATAIFIAVAAYPITHTFNSAKFAAHYVTLFGHMAAPENRAELEQLQAIAKAHIKQEDPAFLSDSMQESYYYNQSYLNRVDEHDFDAIENLIACIRVTAQQIQDPNHNASQKIITGRIHKYLSFVEKQIQSYDNIERSDLIASFLFLQEELKEYFLYITPENRCFADLKYIPCDIYTAEDWENIYFTYSEEIDNISNPQERIEKIGLLIELMAQDYVTENRDKSASRIILLHEDLCTYLESENSNPNTQTASFQKLFDSLAKLSVAMQQSTDYTFSKDTQKQLTSAQKRFAHLVMKNNSEKSSASSKTIIESKMSSSNATFVSTPGSTTNNVGAQLQIVPPPQPQKHSNSQLLRA